MKNLTMYLPGFSHRLCGRRTPLEASHVATGTDALDGLAALAARFVSRATFVPGKDERERVYSPWVTFIAFLGQALTRGSAHRTIERNKQWAREEAWLKSF